MTRLEGKIALVTGTQQGIGRSIAVALSRASADVALPAQALVAEVAGGRRGSILNVASQAIRGAVRGVHSSASKGGVVVVVVASDDARFITGQTVHVNGGSYMP